MRNVCVASSAHARSRLFPRIYSHALSLSVLACGTVVVRGHSQHLRFLLTSQAHGGHEARAESKGPRMQATGGPQEVAITEDDQSDVLQEMKDSPLMVKSKERTGSLSGSSDFHLRHASFTSQCPLLRSPANTSTSHGVHIYCLREFLPKD